MLTGAIASLSFVAGLLFLRFWRSTRDPFFLLFALSFGLEGCNRVALGMLAATDENLPFVYLVRVISYGLILVAIWQKNRRGR
ncbi:hypothetical protein FN976_15160 [Caenimonas sedimenti]|uniref:Uncharacterized protein n=2 Tax=Caenimonas sedimenti TaxID=2596921 RepID=A0A562ZQE5_9BURK|nr:hypothetical protein FN976_15160 [Caenimonas sedimenti]